MKSSGKHIHKALSFLLAVTMITGLLFISGCGNDMPAADGNDTDAPYKTAAEEFFLDRGDGTYTLTEAVYPKDYDGPMPLVAIAHGFKGTRNSGAPRNFPTDLLRRDTLLSEWTSILAPHRKKMQIKPTSMTLNPWRKIC